LFGGSFDHNATSLLIMARWNVSSTSSPSVLVEVKSSVLSSGPTAITSTATIAPIVRAASDERMRLVATDMDNTLLNSHQQISLHNIEAFRKLHTNGIKVAVFFCSSPQGCDSL
jgi:hypothetical protein